MRYLHVASIAVAVAALLTFGPDAQASGTPITSCGQTVTTSAVLTKNLFCKGSPGIVVGASGITIDLRGFTIRGDQTLNDDGVDDTGGFDGLAVKDGFVRNFSRGIQAENADGVRVTNVVVSGNFSDGILVEGNAAQITSSSTAADGNGGIRIDGDFAQIKSSTVFDDIVVVGADARVTSSTSTGGVFGIDVVGGFAQIKSSTASGNFDGIRVRGDAPTVTSSTVSGNKDDGMDIEGDGAVVRSSSASDNSGVGIFVSGNSASLTGNQATLNGFLNYASDLSGLGIDVSFTSIAPVGTNTALANDDPAECSPASLC